jgi:hypothetical protein
MVIANNCTKWVKAVPAQNLEATTVTSKLVNLFWCLNLQVNLFPCPKSSYIGNPERLLSGGSIEH